MGKLSPVSQTELVRRLRKLGFEGPIQRGKHPYMIRGTQRIIIPNPHRQEISTDLLARILRQAGIARHEWDQV